VLVTSRQGSAEGRPEPVAVGWREWVGLPSLGCPSIHAKVDSGADTSALHAPDLAEIGRGGKPWIRFTLLPRAGSTAGCVRVEAPIVDERNIRSSSGQLQTRPVIETDLRLGSKLFPIQITLTDRSEMTYRMLLGRAALAGTALIDCSRAHLLPHPTEVRS